MVAVDTADTDAAEELDVGVALGKADVEDAALDEVVDKDAVAELGEAEELDADLELDQDAAAPDEVAAPGSDTNMDPSTDPAEFVEQHRQKIAREPCGLLPRQTVLRVKVISSFLLCEKKAV